MSFYVSKARGSEFSQSLILAWRAINPRYRVRQCERGTPGLDKLVIDCESGARARVMRAGPGEILHPALFTDP